MVLTMRKGLLLGMAAVAVLASACSGKGARTDSGTGDGSKDSAVSIEVKYATGFSVRDSADVRLVEVGSPTLQSATASLRQGGKYHFALVHSDDVAVPEGYTKVRVPITSTICMTALQLSNFTILDAHDVVKGLTGTKNLFNEDILQRVKDGRIVKIGETGITLVPHLGYQELNPLGQAEWMKFIGMFIGKEREANEVFAGIEGRYQQLKSQTSNLKPEDRPTVTSGEMHYGNWHAVGGKNYLAQIFRDAGADYVINDEETSGENLEFEKMYALAANADYWRILNSFPGEFSYEALKAAEPRNELFKAFKERKVIYCNMKQQPYYEISPVEPDVLLKDFVAIFHPDLVEPDYKPKYYKLLK